MATVAYLRFIAGLASVPGARLDEKNRDVDLASRIMSEAFASYPLGERFLVGRRAQLGDSMVYRPGSSVATELTYGEFDLSFFKILIDRALGGHADGHVFVDVGSGCGRLVLAASVLWPTLARAAGIEFVPELHQIALHAAQCSLLPESPRREFFCADAYDVLKDGAALSDASIVFAYSSAFASEGDVLTDFSQLCGACLRPGVRVVVTDKRLASDDTWGTYAFALLEELQGTNEETGGTSIGYIYEVIRSLRTIA